MKIPFLHMKFPVLIAALSLSVGADAKDFQFNEKKVPETKDDLLSIQQALVDNLPQTRAATVGIKLAQGFGSGVIVSPEGIVLTAAHVSGGVDKELTVVMNDGTEYKAVSMGLISNTDAAMIRIVDEAADGSFPYVEINKNNDYKLGHWVYALGHSGGFDEARGPVVRLGRIVQDKKTTLQTDCKVIGGDSGGPLFDMEGLLIGIHSRVGRETVVENMHVPMREYLSHWDEMEKNEFVGDGPFAKRPVKGSGFLGVGSTDSDEGVTIQKVASESAAEQAGLQVGDIILEINGGKVSDKSEMKTVLAEMAEGDKVEMKISRDGETELIKLKLGKR
jgi:serine protease Do